MKQIALLLSFVLLILSGQSCQSGSEADSGDSQTIFSRKKANEYKVIDGGPIYSFTVVPEQYESCKAVLAQSEEELASGQFIFASDLRKSCVIAVDGRLVTIEILSKQTSNPSAQFYKFEGNGYNIDLEIRQTEKVGNNLKKIRGQLRIFGQAGYRNIFYIIGEVEC